MIDYCQVYNMESYLFDVVRPRFRVQGYLSAFDFFCIVVWKSNRAKSRIARRLLKHDKAGGQDLEGAVRKLTGDLGSETSPKEQLRYLLKEWGFRLPVASAILTVLYPDEFTIYDNRVCDSLGEHHNLANLSQFESIWVGYGVFKTHVIEATPDGLSQRDKDRYLWGKSFYEQLTSDIGRVFGL